MGRGKNRLPDGWAPLRGSGAVVDGTPFVPVKVPLAANFEHGVALAEKRYPQARWMLGDLLEGSGLPAAAGDGGGAAGGASTHPRTIAVIDLTNTDRYYDKDLVLGRGVAYVKVRGLAGHGTIPSRAYAAAFADAVDGIVRRARSGPATAPPRIVVHCTHGYNRTGFMICSYMIAKLGVPASEALRRFAAARPPGIYKAAYIDFLLYSTGELRPGTAAPFAYPPESPLHDDETRMDAVCDTGGVVDAARLAAQEPLFRKLLRGGRDDPAALHEGSVVIAYPEDGARGGVPPKPARVHSQPGMRPHKENKKTGAGKLARRAPVAQPPECPVFPRGRRTLVLCVVVVVVVLHTLAARSGRRVWRQLAMWARGLVFQRTGAPTV